MMNLLVVLLAFVAGGVFAAWRLKGTRTTVQTVRTVISGGGGPGEPDQTGP